MSKEHRKKAKQIINDGIQKFHESQGVELHPLAGNYILNQLMKAGYMNNKVVVHVDECKEEIDMAIFKCVVNEAMGPNEAMLVSGKDRVLITNIRPEIHFASGLVSPCGNDDPDAPVSEHGFEVTCKGCLEALRKK